MQERKPLSHITGGLIIAALLIVYSVVINFAGLTANRSAGFLNYAILIIGVIVVVNMYAKSKDNYVTFGDLFAFGFKTTAVLTVIFLIFIVIFNLLFPEFKEKGMEMAQKQMEEQGNLSEEQIEKGLEMGRKFFWVAMIGGTVLFFLILGAIGSLIGAGIAKKKPVNPLDQLGA